MARPVLTENEVNSIKIKLIDSAISLIKNNGIDSISIKTVSSASKINSAIIYKYFKNLDELTIYAYVDSFYNYYDKIAKINFKQLNTLDAYLLTWKYFASFAYNNKEIVNTLFFSGHEFNLKHIINDYSLLYKKKYNITNESVLNMLSKSNLYERNFQVLQPTLLKNLSDDEIHIINNLLINNFQVELKKIINNGKNITEESFIKNIYDSNYLIIKSLQKK